MSVEFDPAASGAPAHRWNPYPDYKDSDVEWVGKIPVNWEVQKLKYIAKVNLSNVDKKTNKDQDSVKLCNYVDVYYNDYITYDLSFMEATASFNQIDKFALRAGDVIITKDSESWEDIAIPAYVPADLNDVICGYHLAHIRPDYTNINGEYLFRSFCATRLNNQFRVEAHGITRFGLGKYWIDNSLFPVPPINEQKFITTFLEHKTAHIDTLISKKQRLITLLQEKRAALISHTVTKGLDPDVPMKDSGVEWLGEIPAHWEVQKLRRVVEKFVDYRGATPKKVPKGIPLITAKNIKNGVIDFDLSHEFINKKDYNNWMVRGLPEVGDVLITTEAPLGESAQIASSNIALAQRIILLKANLSKVTNDYLKYHFISSSGKGELWSRASGSTAIGIKAYRLKEILVTIPHLTEQGFIVDYLDSETTKLDILIPKIQEAIEKLQEYRTALISAAVTGKIDVRNENRN